MPLVMAPLFWSRLTESFRKPAVAIERAHGDGMIVGQDSPEGFEEILWRSFWPDHYLPDRIVLWSPEDQKGDAQEFLCQHMKKIIALRRPGRSENGRYISKNNGNIARLDLLQKMFPGAKIVVPVRNPLSHATSLMRQHLKFQDIHRQEPFSQRYMADLGHYEFGALHRPIAFPGLTDWTGGRDAVAIDYWLGYWIAAFEYVLERRDNVILISYEAMCADPHQGLAQLCRRLKIPQEQLVERAAVLFRKPPARPDEASQADKTLCRHAQALHQALLEPYAGEQAN